jgi:hypothetical protein
LALDSFKFFLDAGIGKGSGVESVLAGGGRSAGGESFLDIPIWTFPSSPRAAGEVESLAGGGSGAESTAAFLSFGSIFPRPAGGENHGQADHVKK